MNNNTIEKCSPIQNSSADQMNKRWEDIEAHPNSRFKIENDLDAEVLKLLLIDAVACAAMFLIAAPFISSEDQYIAAGFTALTLILSWGAKYVGTAYQKQEKKNDFTSKIANIATNSSFILALYPGKYINTLVHECGHYLAIKCTDASAQPDLSISANFNGLISYKSSPLIKENNLLITAAGPMADIALACACIALAHFQKSKKNLCAFLYASAVLSVVSSVAYAGSAYENRESRSHDYAVLWKGGIHPVISMINILAFPLLTKLGLVAFDKYCETGEIPLIPAIHEKMLQLANLITDEENPSKKTL